MSLRPVFTDRGSCIFTGEKEFTKMWGKPHLFNIFPDLIEKHSYSSKPVFSLAKIIIYQNEIEILVHTY